MKNYPLQVGRFRVEKIRQHWHVLEPMSPLGWRSLSKHDSRSAAIKRVRADHWHEHAHKKPAEGDIKAGLKDGTE